MKEEGKRWARIGFRVVPILHLMKGESIEITWKLRIEYGKPKITWC